MANESSEDRGGPAKRSRNWDSGDGLGWELARNASSTALSTRSIQRTLAHHRANILRDPAPLLTVLHRRWGIAGDSIVNRFNRFSPLLWAQRRSFDQDAPREPAAVASLSRHRSAESPIFSTTLELPLTGARKFSPAMRLGAERNHEPGSVQRRFSGATPIGISSDVQGIEQKDYSSKPQAIGSARSFDTFNTVVRRSSPPQRTISGDSQPLTVYGRSPLLTSVVPRQDLRLSGSAQTMTRTFPSTQPARFAARPGAASVPPLGIAFGSGRDFSTVLSLAPLRDLQAPALQQSQAVGAQMPSRASLPSAVMRASDGQIGPSKFMPLLDTSGAGGRINATSRIVIAKEPIARRSFERTIRTKNVAGDIIRPQPRSLLQAEHDAELPVELSSRRDEFAGRIAAKPAQQVVVQTEPMLARQETAGAQFPTTVLSRRPEYEAMVATPLPLPLHSETPPPLHAVTPRNASSVAREILLSRAQQSPKAIKAEDQGAHAADRHDPADGIAPAPPSGTMAKSVEVRRPLDKNIIASAPAVDVSRNESNSQAARRLQPLVYGATLLSRFFDHRTTRLLHGAGDPPIARRVSPLTQAHYSGERPMQRSAERAGVASSPMATIRRVAELTEPGARTPAGMMSYAAAPSSMAQTSLDVRLVAPRCK